MRVVCEFHFHRVRQAEGYDKLEISISFVLKKMLNLFFFFNIGRRHKGVSSMAGEEGQVFS